MRVIPILQAATGLALALGAGAVLAQSSSSATSTSTPTSASPSPATTSGLPTLGSELPPVTWDVQAARSRFSAGLPDGESLAVRATVALPGDSSLQSELMQERKFGERGGTLSVAYTTPLAPDWFATGTLVAGQGGPNWANARTDLQISTKWLEQRQLVTSAALYHAVFDGSRSDSGLRLSATLYLADPAVLEAGVTFNLSQPGSVNSDMPYAAITFGRAGEQYLSLRVSNGTESYQALGTGAQLVNFHSRTVAASWRRWIGPQWGITAQAEHYRNPTYQRQTLGLGVFAQW